MHWVWPNALTRLNIRAILECGGDFVNYLSEMAGRLRARAREDGPPGREMLAHFARIPTSSQLEKISRVQGPLGSEGRATRAGHVLGRRRRLSRIKLT